MALQSAEIERTIDNHQIGKDSELDKIMDDYVEADAYGCYDFAP